MVTGSLACKLLVAEGKPLLTRWGDEWFWETGAGSNAAHGMAHTVLGERGEDTTISLLFTPMGEDLMSSPIVSS